MQGLEVIQGKGGIYRILVGVGQSQPEIAGRYKIARIPESSWEFTIHAVPLADETQLALSTGTGVEDLTEKGDVLVSLDKNSEVSKGEWVDFAAILQLSASEEDIILLLTLESEDKLEVYFDWLTVTLGSEESGE